MFALPIALIITSLLVEAKPSPRMFRMLNATRANAECKDECDAVFEDSAKATEKLTCEGACDQKTAVCAAGKAGCISGYKEAGSMSDDDVTTLCNIVCGSGDDDDDDDDDDDYTCTSDDCKDCLEDCKDEFKGKETQLEWCYSGCAVNNGKCPKEYDSHSKCKDAYEKNDDISEDDWDKICDIVCPASLWWIGLVVGLVVVIAVVVVLVIVCFVKKLLCFKSSA